MKIKKISKMKNDRYLITFDDDQTITTYDEIILKYRLLPGVDIDINLFNNIEEETNIDKVYYKVVQMISKKLRSKMEIIKYLDKLEIEENYKNIIIDKLINNKLIDDERFARAFTYDRFNLSSDGPKLIIKKLEDLSIKKIYIDKALELIKEEEIAEKLNRLMKKKTANNTKYSNYILKQKIYQYFIKLGYESDMIITLFEKNKVNNNTIDKSYLKIKNRLKNKYDGEELTYNIKNRLYKLGYSREEIDKKMS